MFFFFALNSPLEFASLNPGQSEGIKQQFIALKRKLLFGDVKQCFCNCVFSQTQKSVNYP